MKELEKINQNLEEIKKYLERIEKLVGHFVFLFRALNDEYLKQLQRRGTKIIVPNLTLKAKDK